MSNLLQTLTAQLDVSTRSSVLKHAERLMRDIQYEGGKQPPSPDYNTAISSGWTVDCMEVICCLNAFYQIVIGPLASVVRNRSKLGLGRNTVIAYGDKIRITQEETNSLSECHDQFCEIIRQQRIDFWLLQSASARDLLYKLAHPRTK
jgi:hypothetical protein